MQSARAAPLGQHAHTMGVIAEQPSVMGLAKNRQLIQRRDVPIHREHAVGGDQRAASPRPLGPEAALQVRHIVVRERDDPCAGELGARPDAGVGQRVDQNHVARTDQGWNDAEIGQVARAEHASRLGPLQTGQSLFEVGQQGVIAGDEARGGRARARRAGGAE